MYNTQLELSSRSYLVPKLNLRLHKLTAGLRPHTQCKMIYEKENNRNYFHNKYTEQLQQNITGRLYHSSIRLNWIEALSCREKVVVGLSCRLQAHVQDVTYYAYLHSSLPLG